LLIAPTMVGKCLGTHVTRRNRANASAFKSQWHPPNQKSLGKQLANACTVLWKRQIQK
jgi:hypothetical protein